MNKKYLLLSVLLLAVSLFGRNAMAQTATEKDYQMEYKHTMKKAYIDSVLETKTKQLQGYLNILIEKKQPDYAKAIIKAMTLFNNDESKLISVTSKITGKTTVKPIRTYLRDVAKLPYKSINITYRNYSTIENIRKQPDGTFRGAVVFDQEFMGFDKEGNAIYHDEVRRNTEVTIKLKEYMKDDKHTVDMDIFFGNLGVTEL